MKVLLSKSAEKDLESIDDYTIEHFGLHQAVEVRAEFKRVFTRLGELPNSFPIVEKICPPHRCLRCCTVLGSFVVVYESVEGEVRVARILHGARHLLAELKRDPGDDS